MTNFTRENPEIIFTFPDFPKGFSYHLGVAYIQSYLWERDILSFQYIEDKPLALEDYAEKIVCLSPSIVGFSCYDANYYYIKLLAESIKKKRPNLIIVLGGPSATFSDDLIIKDCSAIDICARGEGEQTMYEIFLSLKGDKSFADIKGITYRKNNKIVKNIDRPLLRGNGKSKYQLDILPSPYLTGVIPLEKIDSIGVISSRGCIFRCSFCNFTAMSRSTIRFHSPARVVQELEKIHTIRPNAYVHIFDDTFTLSCERTKEICQELIKKKLNLRLSCLTRADFVNKELLEIMYQAGFRNIVFGLESGVPKVLKAAKKCCLSNKHSKDFSQEKNFLSRIKENIKIAKNLGFDAFASVILGLPTEKLEDGVKTINFVKELDLKLYTHNYLNIYPGTELFRTYKKHGIKIKNPPTTLPFIITKYAYDVSKVPVLKNSRLNSRKNDKIYNGIRTIRGGFYKSSNLKYPLEIIFLNNMQRIGSRILKSVKKFIIPASAISIISDSNSQKDIKAIYKKFVQSEISVTSFNLFNSSNWNLRLNEANKFIFNRISFGRIDVEDKIFSIYFHFIPFDDYLKIKDIPFDEATDENVIIFSLKDYVDIDQLIKLEKRISTNGYFFLPPPLNCYNCSFIEGCRWSDYPCNAVNLSRMVIDEDFLIRPCIFGEPIGKIYENREKLIEKLRDLKKREERKRGCERCEIKESCSRCLFPSPLTSKDFCTIRKKHANIPEIIRFFDVRTIFMHSANNNSLEGLEKSNLVMRLNDRESNYDRRYIQNKSINEKCGEEKNLSRLFTVQNKDQNIRLFYYKDMMYTFNLKSNSIRKFSN